MEGLLNKEDFPDSAAKEIVHREGMEDWKGKFRSNDRKMSKNLILHGTLFVEEAHEFNSHAWKIQYISYVNVNNALVRPSINQTLE